MTLILAMLLDAAVGEPKAIYSRVPHPAVLMGRLIGWADNRFNQGEDPKSDRRRNGILTMLALAIGALILGKLLTAFGPLVEILVLAALLAQRSLVDHVRDVANALRLSEGDGRMMVARIVGRDTSAMDGPAISRAAIESAAENFSDGVIAPIFWFALLGLPGLLLYKITNTADSMIGYRTERHRDYGWAAARFDDLLNLIPARLTAALIAATHQVFHGWPLLVRDARQHRSPNAGWPEAAMARALNVALSGPRSYDGEMRDFPYVNVDGSHNANPDHIDAACTALWRVWGVVLGLALLLTLF
ncbi:cobalamin biosynthesis protein [Thalassovita autumnalis]|uniref:Cobalamin biosynthesis protein CobD n=1 Tax=Thalassovita autumnalis TaxID=2072972 RepID=A0A0P1FKK9_9RHOB|nr:adenosylcobinamide-phosphate synthase CbiB [Thalassovita autumnalis]CUH68644.1 cobalamin biosynthesis protein [Thalassovita autumnalis]CUH74108.1 cobalamin biosynthesis protein [Thalassovita autumnalis]